MPQYFKNTYLSNERCHCFLLCGSLIKCHNWYTAYFKIRPGKTTACQSFEDKQQEITSPSRYSPTRARLEPDQGFFHLQILQPSAEITEQKAYNEALLVQGYRKGITGILVNKSNEPGSLPKCPPRCLALISAAGEKQKALSKQPYQR